MAYNSFDSFTILAKDSRFTVEALNDFNCKL